MLESDMPHVTVTTTIVAFVRSMRDAPAYHATHLALLNPALRPKSFNDLIEFAENIKEHKPQEQTPSSSQAMAASSREGYAGRGSASTRQGNGRGRARGGGRTVRSRLASCDGPGCGFRGTRYHDDKDCRTQHQHLASFGVNEPANDEPHYTRPTFLDSAAFPSFLDDQREFLSPLVPSPGVTLANGRQIPTQIRASAAARHARGQLHIS
jgi:hypothetical protein